MYIKLLHTDNPTEKNVQEKKLEWALHTHTHTLCTYKRCIREIPIKATLDRQEDGFSERVR